jgi:hypothetical protein
MRLTSFLAASLLCTSLSYAQAPQAQPTTGDPSDKENKQGFVSLFDGKTLQGWQGSTKGYVPQRGVLVCKKKGGGRLLTTKEYADFIFRFEFKLDRGGNNGVAVRAPAQGHISRLGIEIQILDDDAPQYKNLAPYQYHGSIYGMVPAKRGHLKPVGQWNAQEVLCDGSRIKVTLNGAVIADADLEQLGPTTMDGRDHPGRKRKKGFVGFIGHGTRVEFRNIRIKEL